MKMTIHVVPGDRTQRGSSNDAVNYRYVIKTGSQCPGLMSVRKYKDSLAAYSAGERMARKIRG